MSPASPVPLTARSAQLGGEELSKVDAIGGFLALHFRPGFQLMYDLSMWLHEVSRAV